MTLGGGGGEVPDSHWCGPVNARFVVCGGQFLPPRASVSVGFQGVLTRFGFLRRALYM